MNKHFKNPIAFALALVLLFSNLVTAVAADAPLMTTWSTQADRIILNAGSTDTVGLLSPNGQWTTTLAPNKTLTIANSNLFALSSIVSCEATNGATYGTAAYGPGNNEQIVLGWGPGADKGMIPLDYYAGKAIVQFTEAAKWRANLREVYSQYQPGYDGGASSTIRYFLTEHNGPMEAITGTNEHFWLVDSTAPMGRYDFGGVTGSTWNPNWSIMRTRKWESSATLPGSVILPTAGGTIFCGREHQSYPRRFTVTGTTLPINNCESMPWKDWRDNTNYGDVPNRTVASNQSRLGNFWFKGNTLVSIEGDQISYQMSTANKQTIRYFSQNTDCLRTAYTYDMSGYDKNGAKADIHQNTPMPQVRIDRGLAGAWGPVYQDLNFAKDQSFNQLNFYSTSPLAYYGSNATKTGEYLYFTGPGNPLYSYTAMPKATSYTNVTFKPASSLSSGTYELGMYIDASKYTNTVTEQSGTKYTERGLFYNDGVGVTMAKAVLKNCTSSGFTIGGNWIGCPVTINGGSYKGAPFICIV